MVAVEAVVAPLPPPQPSVTVSGNNGTYWQDDTISISFSVRNMDTSTVSYAVSGGFDEDYFVADAAAGTFKSIDGEPVQSGAYSMTVTATDGGGKTASRSFQFTVDVVMTGYYEACDPTQGCDSEGGRSVFIDATREGPMSIDFWAYDGLDWQGGVSTVHHLTCFGSVDVDGADINGSNDCKGQFPQSVYFDNSGQPNGHTDFRPIARIELTTNFADSTYGVLSFYDESGNLLETWETYIRQLQRNYGQRGIVNNSYWPTNAELQGKYALIAIQFQYQESVAFNVWSEFFQWVREDWGPFNRHEFLDNDEQFIAGTPIFDIDANHNFVPNNPVENVGSCAISGKIRSLSLNGYASTTSLSQNSWCCGGRVMSVDYSATACDTLQATLIDYTFLFSGEVISPNVSINQSSGFATVDPYIRRYFTDGQYVGEDWALSFQGPGDANPFEFFAAKVCNADGSATIANRFGQIDCSNDASKSSVGMTPITKDVKGESVEADLARPKNRRPRTVTYQGKQTLETTTQGNSKFKHSVSRSLQTSDRSVFDR